MQSVSSKKCTRSARRVLQAKLKLHLKLSAGRRPPLVQRPGGRRPLKMRSSSTVQYSTVVRTRERERDRSESDKSFLEYFVAEYILLYSEFILASVKFFRDFGGGGDVAPVPPCDATGTYVLLYTRKNWSLYEYYKNSLILIIQYTNNVNYTHSFETMKY